MNDKTKLRRITLLLDRAVTAIQLRYGLTREGAIIVMELDQPLPEREPQDARPE